VTIVSQTNFTSITTKHNNALQLITCNTQKTIGVNGYKTKEFSSFIYCGYLWIAKKMASMAAKPKNSIHSYLVVVFGWIIKFES